MKIAIVHDWLTGLRGGEKVLLALLELFPSADLFTLVYRPEKMPDPIRSRKITVSALQYLPAGKTRYPYYLPLYGWLTGGMDLSDYDLIVSSSSACAKWAPNPKRVPHVCYCHTPMRYIWDMFDDYFGPRAFTLVRMAARFFRPMLQRRDLRSNQGVTHFIANSAEVKERIARLYGRDAQIIHPPVEVDSFSPVRAAPDYFLVISALVPYKRVDLAVRVCAARNWPLVVVGSGPERKRLEKMAGPRTRFVGWVSDGEMPRWYAGAKALLFPGKEDFGIVPVESLASGCPVIAFGEGGVRDTLSDGATGALFQNQTPQALEEAIDRFLASPPPDPKDLRLRAQGFSKDLFLARVREYFITRPELGRFLS